MPNASAFVFEAIDFPLGTIIGSVVAVAWLTHFTGIKQKYGIDTHDLAILLICLAVSSQGIPEIIDLIPLWPVSLLIMVICVVFISLRLRVFFYQYLYSYLFLRKNWSHC